MAEIYGFANYPEILKTFVNKDNLVKIDRDIKSKSQIYDTFNLIKARGNLDSKFKSFLNIFDKVFSKWMKYAVFSKQRIMIQEELADGLYRFAIQNDPNTFKHYSISNFFWSLLQKDSNIKDLFASNIDNLINFYEKEFEEIVDLLQSSSLTLESQNLLFRKKVDLVLRIEEYLNMETEKITKTSNKKLNIGYDLSKLLSKLNELGFNSQLLMTNHKKKEVYDVNDHEIIYSTEFKKPEYKNGYPIIIYNKLNERLENFAKNDPKFSYIWKNDELSIISENIQEFDRIFFSSMFLNDISIIFNKSLIIKKEYITNESIVYVMKNFTELLKNQLEGLYINEKYWGKVEDINDKGKKNIFIDFKSNQHFFDIVINKFKEFKDNQFVTNPIIYKIIRTDPETKIPKKEQKEIIDEKGNTILTEEIVFDDKIKITMVKYCTVNDSSLKLKFLFKNEFEVLNEFAKEYRDYFLQTYGLLPLLIPRKRYEEYDGSRGVFDVQNSITRTINNAKFLASQRFKKRIDEDPIYLYFAIDVSGSMSNSITSCFFLSNVLSVMFEGKAKKYILGFICDSNLGLFALHKESVEISNIIKAYFNKFLENCHDVLEFDENIKLIVFIKNVRKITPFRITEDLSKINKDQVPTIIDYNEALQAIKDNSILSFSNDNEIIEKDEDKEDEKNRKKISIKEFKRKLDVTANEILRIIRGRFNKTKVLMELQKELQIHIDESKRYNSLNNEIEEKRELQEAFVIRDKIALNQLTMPKIYSIRQEFGRYYIEFENFDEFLFTLYNSFSGGSTHATVIEDLVLHEDINKRGLKYFFVITDAAIYETSKGDGEDQPTFERWYNPISKKYEGISSITSMTYWLDTVNRRPDTRASLINIYSIDTESKFKELDKENITPTLSYFIDNAKATVNLLTSYYDKKKEINEELNKNKITKNEYNLKLVKLNLEEDKKEKKSLAESYFNEFLITYWDNTILTTPNRIMRSAEIENILKKLQDQKYFVY